MPKADAEKVAAIVRDAGGQIIGRTRLQKVAYLLTIAGLEDGPSFAYKHYGPYSEVLANAAREAALFGLLSETEAQAQWGGTFSTYRVAEMSPVDTPLARRRLAETAAAANAIELELAATAAFLAREGQADPWGETARRKPDKAADGRLDRAQELYRRLAQIEVPQPLPAIA